MSISMRKVLVLTSFKMKELFKNKTFLISLFLVPGFTLGMRYMYSSLTDGDLSPVLLAMVINMGVLYNLNAISLMMPATMLAKDKEKNTLRTLMTSSVNGAEYFISGVIPSLVTSIFINVVVLLISGLPLGEVNILMYLIITTIAGLTSCIIGMIVGIFSKNQMASTNLLTVVMIVLMMIPMFADMVDSMKTVSGYLYTGIVTKMIGDFTAGKPLEISLLSWGVLLGGVVLSIGAFVMFYKRNGFECD